jgi:hypothetical protein
VFEAESREGMVSASRTGGDAVITQNRHFLLDHQCFTESKSMPARA